MKKSDFDITSLDMFMYQVLDSCKQILNTADKQPFAFVHIAHIDEVVLMWLVQPVNPNGGHVAWALEWSDDLTKHLYAGPDSTKKRGIMTAYSLKNQERLYELMKEYCKEPGVRHTFYYWKEDKTDETLAA